MVGTVGVEPTKTYLYAGRLQRLELTSAQRTRCLVGMVGFEPTKP